MKKITGLVVLFSVALGCLALPAEAKKTEDTTKTTKTTTTESSTASKKVTPQKDYYQYVNQDWLKEHPIPKDQSSWGAFNVAQKTVDDQLIKDFAAMVDGKKATPSELSEFIKYHELALDTKSREKAGTKELKTRLKKIEKLTSMDDVNQQASELVLNGWQLPVSIDVSNDQKDTSVNRLYVSEPDLFLGDKSYYEKDSKEGKQLKDGYTKMLRELFVETGYQKDEAKKMATRAMRFDASLVKTTLAPEKAVDPEVTYNPKSLAEVKKLSQNFKTAELLQALAKSEPKEVIVSNLAYLKKLDQIFSQDTLEDYKAWALANEVHDASGLLNKKMLAIKNDYELLESGAKKAQSMEQQSYVSTTTTFRDPVGIYYGKTYLGNESKEKVTQMVTDSVAIYRKRL